MNNKKNIIISSVVIIVLLCIALGILYFTTDLLKTEQQLFYKYIAQIKTFDTNFIQQYEDVDKKITKNTNSSNMNIDFEKMVQNLETTSAESQKILNIKSNGLHNALTSQSYRDFTLSSNEQNFLTLKYLKDGNTHALFADNIVAKYLAVENSNLKDFFAKLGVEDTTTIPDSIPTNYDEILKIDEATLNQLKETYGTLIYTNINEENFYKISNTDKTQTIGVSLSEKELIDIVKLILETAKNDNTFLNLIVSKAKLLNYNNITVETIQTEIQKIIDEMINQTYLTDANFLKIELTKNGKVVTKINVETNLKETTGDIDDINETELKEIKQNIELIFSEPNKIVLLIKENDIENYKTTIEYAYDNNNIDLNIEIQILQNNILNTMKVRYQINNYLTDNIVQNLVIDINSNLEENYKIKMVNNITLKQDVQISKLTTENSAKLNNMTQEELSILFTALINRINTLYNFQNNSFIM